MQRHRNMKIIIQLCLTLTLLLSSVLPGYAAGLTQRDWMVLLVDTFGWTYGLPDEPQDPDYINILTGNREFRFEAEDVYAQGEANVSLMSFRNFGPYSGHGWLHGTRNPTAVHLKFTLPLDGEYLIQAHLRQAGHQFSINGTEKSVDAESKFTMVTVGSYHLQAGTQEITVTLPPNGSIDYISLKAPNLAAVTPDEGWQPDEPLSWATIQITLLQLLHLAELFPSNPLPVTIEAESLDQEKAKVVTIPHLGHPSGGKWLRAGPLPTEVSFPFKLSESGFYDLTLRVMGNPVDISIGDHQEINLEAKPYLDDYTFKPLFLFAGTSDITLRLPPGGGVDSLTLTERQLGPALVNTLLGHEDNGEPGTRDLNKLTSLLAAFGVER